MDSGFLWAYNCVRISERDEWKTAFTANGHSEYPVIPLGLINAPSGLDRLKIFTFVHFINKCLITSRIRFMRCCTDFWEAAVCFLHQLCESINWIYSDLTFGGLLIFWHIIQSYSCCSFTCQRNLRESKDTRPVWSRMGAICCRLYLSLLFLMDVLWNVCLSLSSTVLIDQYRFF